MLRSDKYIILIMVMMNIRDANDSFYCMMSRRSWCKVHSEHRGVGEDDDDDCGSEEWTSAEV